MVQITERLPFGEQFIIRIGRPTITAPTPAKTPFQLFLDAVFGDSSRPQDPPKTDERPPEPEYDRVCLVYGAYRDAEDEIGPYLPTSAEEVDSPVGTDAIEVPDCAWIDPFRKESSTLDFYVGHHLEPGEWYQFRFIVLPKSGAKATWFDIDGRAAGGFGQHFDVDFGGVWAPESELGGVSVNAHIHLVPINKNSPEIRWRERVSLFAGVTVVEFNKPTGFENRVAAGALTAGVGVRTGASFRLLGGIMFYRQADPNPLVDAVRDKRDFFLGASVDFTFNGILGPLGSLIGLGG